MPGEDEIKRPGKTGEGCEVQNGGQREAGRQSSMATHPGSARTSPSISRKSSEANFERPPSKHDEASAGTTTASKPNATDKVQSSSARSRARSSVQDTPSIASTSRTRSGARGEKVSDLPGRLNELKRFTLWETKTHFYLVAYNTSQTLFRTLKIDRLPGSQISEQKQQKQPQKQHEGSSQAQAPATEARPPVSDADEGSAHTTSTPHARSMQWSLNVTADNVVYTRTQISELLDMISEGNRSTGGLKEVGRFFGIVGFIRFTSTYYMVLISRRSVVGLLGGHYLYHCDETKIIPVCPTSVLTSVGGRTKVLDQEEAHLLHTFKQVDLGKNFYFSYTYDLTKTLQDNLTQPAERKSAQTGQGDSITAWGYNEKFIWNHHLLLPAFSASENNAEADSASQWVLPLVYGFVDQAKLRVLNCTIHVTLIARRSRHFAGARFLKRGTDEKGHVANDVETEQIISDALTTPFYAPSHDKRQGRSGKPGGAKRGPNPRYTSYVMHRGSIPIFWTQDSTNMSPRPPIEISVVDPYYSSAALHFDDMLRRYGGPIIVLNLIKSKEKQPREVKLLYAFGECIRYLNQFLPPDKRLRYIAWDMSRASKSRDQDVIGVLEDIAEETISATKFFHSGPEPNKFAYRSLEQAADGNDTASPATHRHVRDTILLQSGVARVNCVDCLDRTNAAQFVIGKAAFGHQLYALGLLDHPSLPFDSDAIDMLTEMYHDLGDTIALQYGGSHLVNTMETYRKINQWTSHSRDMLEGLKRYYSNSFVDAEKQAAINLFLGVDNDAPDYRPVHSRVRRHYQQWYTPAHLEARGTVAECEARLEQIVAAASSFWVEYYRPSLFTDLMRHHAFKMTAIHQQQRAIAMGSTTVQQPGTPGSSSRRLSSSSSRDSMLLQSPSKSSMTHASSEPTPSPFISRVPLPVASPSKTGSQQSAVHGGQRALIGGVRRWMSLNRGDHDTSTSTDRKVSAKRTASDKAMLEVSAVTPTVASQEAHPPGLAAILSAASAWPTWDEITGAGAAATATENLLRSLLSPSVSAEDVKEYSMWLAQFRDVTFDGGIADIPEPAVLLPASHVQHATGGSQFVPQGFQATSTMEHGMVAHSTLAAPQQPHAVGIRRPATQKQRQQIADADAHLYDREVSLAAGDYRFLSIGHGTEHYSTGDGSVATAIEPALLHYAMAANMLHAPPSDAKVRAYTHWLAGHSHALPIVAP